MSTPADDAAASATPTADASSGALPARPSSGTPAPKGSSSSSSDSRRVAPKWLGKKIGRFRLQALLGQGAVGRVFRAEDSILHRRVALKVISIHSDGGQINRNADQFLTEARAAAALEHPHVVQIYEAGESGNLCYIAMELLDGGSLKDLVVAGGPMDPGRACLLTADAAEALAAGHEAGIVHRDVKPANLMLSRQGRCKVTDFGLATFGDLDSVSTEKAAGTPLFAAPEVIRGTSADERSDIYSLGATLYYLLTGRPPYSASTRAEVLRMHVEEPIPDLRVIRPGLPESLVVAVERALDKDPGQRFASATQFARVLRVQTIPVAPMPTLPAPAPNGVGGDSMAGASLLNLSGMTAVTGSSGRLGTSGSVGSGNLTAGDLLTGGMRSAPAARPAPVSYATPPAPAPAWWRTPGGRIGIAAAAGVAVIVALVGIVLLARGSRSTPTVAIAPPLATPVVPPPAPTPSVAAPVPAVPSPTPVVVSAPLVPPPIATVPPAAASAVPAAVPRRPLVTPNLTAAELEPIPVTDVDRLHRIADGKDPDRPNRYATVVGRVVQTRPSVNGRTIRIEFAGTKFWIAYWATNKAISDHMAQRFGDNAAGLVGQTIRVTERVTIYDGLPELILTATEHVKLEPN